MDRKRKNIPKIELMYPPCPYKIYKYKCNIFMISNKKNKYNNSIRWFFLKEKEYLFLIKSAVNNYFGTNNNSIFDIFTIINPKNECIPISDRNVKKKRLL